MVTRHCECCHFTTKYKNVFDNHIKSKRHLKIHEATAAKKEEAEKVTTVHMFTCDHCQKKYKTKCGWKRHSTKCNIQPTTKHVTAGENRMVGINHMELLQTQMTELQKQIACLQPQLANFKPSVTTHNNTNTQNNNIHIYLNTHCNNAMTIDEFVESMKFVKDDFNEIDRNRFYYQGATKILKKYFQMLKPEDRPIHCAVPLLNKPTTFFVKSESEWKEECQSMIHYQMKYIEEFENKEEQLAMTRFFERFNEKLYETYKELSTLDKHMEKRINDKMMGGGSRDKIDMLDELVDSKIIKINVNG